MAAEDTQYVTFSEDGSIVIATVCNTTMLEGMLVVEFGRQVLDYVGTRSAVSLLLDFENIDYLASAALTELIKINDAAVAGGGAMRICGLTPNIRKVFEITNFTKVFEILADENVGHATARFKRSLEIAREEDDWDERHQS